MKRPRWRIVALAALAAALAIAARPVGRRCLASYDVLRARRLLAEVEIDKAIDWLRAAEGWQPERAETQFLLAVANRRGRRFRPAREHLERAEALGWPQMDLERQRMMILFQMGHIREAEPFLTTVPGRGVSDEVAEDTYEALVMGYLTEFRLNEAGVCLGYWIGWQPDRVRPRLWRAELYTALGDTSRLQAELREILRIDPQRLNERLVLAHSLLDGKQADAALAECETCFRQAPGDPRVSLGLGLCHYHQGRLAEAKRELESAAAAGMEEWRQVAALTALGELAADARDFDRAAKHYQDAITIAPHNSAAVYGLGTALAKLGKTELAERQLRRSQALDAQANRLVEINHALMRDTNDVNLRVEAARILLEQGRRTDAASWMMSALHYDPKLREAHEMLADYFAELGEETLVQYHRDAAREETETPDSAVSPAG
ncbi:MAG TPA: tetratricopeptide repeat protein [Pirellulales bacterium]|jgi:tetratricopeptide (TPR) repeat protein|nr:tetratricopeptide repeat protein [Pirellulales bacterium]